MCPRCWATESWKIVSSLIPFRRQGTLLCEGTRSGIVVSGTHDRPWNSPVAGCSGWRAAIRPPSTWTGHCPRPGVGLNIPDRDRGTWNVRPDDVPSTPWPRPSRRSALGWWSHNARAIAAEGCPQGAVTRVILNNRSRSQPELNFGAELVDAIILRILSRGTAEVGQLPRFARPCSALDDPRSWAGDESGGQRIATDSPRTDTPHSRARSVALLTQDSRLATLAVGRPASLRTKGGPAMADIQDDAKETLSDVRKVGANYEEHQQAVGLDIPVDLVHFK